MQRSETRASFVDPLPWSGADEPSQTRMRSALVLASSLARCPPRPGSLREAMGLAFPPRPGGDEEEAFVALAQASRRHGLALCDFSEAEARAAIEWAPSIHGGEAFAQCPELSRSARLAFAHALAEALARHLDRPGLAATASGDASGALAALAKARALDWPPAPALAIATPMPGHGALDSWPAWVAAKRRMALAERASIEPCCRPAPHGSPPRL